MKVKIIIPGKPTPKGRPRFSRKTGIQYKNISKVLVGKRIKAGGYHWEYCNED